MSDVKVKVVSSKKRERTYDRQDESRIADVIRKDVLPKTKLQYHSVNVKVHRNSDGSATALVAYMLRKDSYTADVKKIVVDGQYNIQKIEENYDDSSEATDDSEEDYVTISKHAHHDIVDFVTATPVPDIPTAKAAVENVAALVRNAGLTCRILLGAEATVGNYKKYLSSGLMGFVNVGHGYTGGIVLDDGNLTADSLSLLRGGPLSPGVVYFNSCQVHNPPLEPAVMKAGARTYIGGNVNLLIGPSEKVCQGFWERILKAAGEEMGAALKASESENYPAKDAHGVSGDLGCFRAGHAMVCQHAELRGHHRHIFGWEKNLNRVDDRSLNDQISSFVILSGTWKFYRDSNYVMPYAPEFGPGIYRWVEAVGVSNDQVSSLRCVHS
jgi:hypothetical protein